MHAAQSDDEPIDVAMLGLPKRGCHPHTNDFRIVLAAELAAINARRRRLDTQRDDRSKRGEVKILRPDEPLDNRAHTYDTTGLALSGGGIRSAAFCLGTLQALAVNGAIEGIDYLSTVSGGGYIGSSMTAGMQFNGGICPFAEKAEWADLPSVRHLRDYANYLMPKGTGDLITALCIIVRGLVANAVLVLPYLLAAACFTIALYPNLTYLTGRDSDEMALAPPFPHDRLDPTTGIWWMQGFHLTLMVLGVTIAFLAAWALWRSWRIAAAKRNGGSRITTENSVELTGGFARMAKFLFYTTVLMAFWELQPFVLLAMFNGPVSPLTQHLHEWTTSIAPILAPFAGVIAFLSRRIGEILKTTAQEPGPAAMIRRILGHAAIWFAAIVLPSLIWLIYLELTYFGIASDAAGSNFQHAPGWLLLLSAKLHSSLWTLYALSAALLFAIGMGIGPNATTLHQLYRDRLSKAFLFDPTRRGTFPVAKRPLGPESSDLDQAGGLRLHAIDPSLAPYQLINAALNLEGSRESNRRGRNADFFIFGQEFTGSEPVGFIGTHLIEKSDPALDLGTAMAISGAAVSSNMGAETIKPWAITLALLNFRLGYWLNNPSQLRGCGRQSQATKGMAGLRRSLVQWLKLYFFREMFGLLDESDSKIYLTDGGHIENLGVYALLKRRCQLIIAIDAEADKAMNFGALVILQRYARIDLGVRIDLPWQKIRACARETDLACRSKPSKSDGPPPAVNRQKGPHCAFGTITYRDGAEGLLLYVKASLSGDENDDILDYKRRNPDFPHETTGDQFFTEEQFEVYRSLGFHVLDGVFKGTNEISHVAANLPQAGSAGSGSMNRFKHALGL
jgi:hypothetical protein